MKLFAWLALLLCIPFVWAIDYVETTAAVPVTVFLDNTTLRINTSSQVLFDGNHNNDVNNLYTVEHQRISINITDCSLNTTIINESLQEFSQKINNETLSNIFEKIINQSGNQITTNFQEIMNNDFKDRFNLTLELKDCEQRERDAISDTNEIRKDKSNCIDNQSDLIKIMNTLRILLIIIIVVLGILALIYAGFEFMGWGKRRSGLSEF